MCRLAGITASYDTSSYELNGIHGSLFNGFQGGMSNVFAKEQKNVVYHPTQVALANLLLVQNYWTVVERLPFAVSEVPALLGPLREDLPVSASTEDSNSAWIARRWQAWVARLQKT